MEHSNNYYNKKLLANARELRSVNATKAERFLWKSFLSKKQSGERVLRQRPILNFIVDFFIPDIKLIIEIDGSSHLSKASHDSFRQTELQKHGFTIIRFKEGDVLNNIDDMCQKISHAIYCLKEEL